MKTFPSYDQLYDILTKVADAITRKKAELVPNELTEEEMSIVRSLISGGSISPVACDITIDLNNSWSFNSGSMLPEGYNDGRYAMCYSNSNKGVHNSVCSMYLVFRNVTQAGNFKILACSNGETDYDYIQIYKLDSDDEIAKEIKTAKDPSVASNYTPVDIYVPNDGHDHDHVVRIDYIKDGSESSNDDCGYVIISAEGINKAEVINAYAEPAL